MTNEIIIIVGGVVTNIVTGFSSWFFTRRKYNVEVKASDISNMQESLEFYKKLSDDNKKRLEDLLEYNKELREQNIRLEAKCDKLEEKLDATKTEVLKLVGQICLNMECTLRTRQLPLFKNQGSNDTKVNKKIQEK